MTPTTDTPISAARDPRLCTHPGKDGNGCMSWARKDGSGLCQGHSTTPEQLAQARERSAEVRRQAVAERPKSLKDAVAKRLEQRADEIAALVDVEITRQDSRAVIGWIEQVYGKPQQTVVTEDGSKPAEDLTLAELEKLRQRILEGDTNVTSLRKTA